MADGGNLTLGSDSGTWQELYAPSTVLTADQSLVYQGANPRMIEIIGTAGTLKLERYDGTFVTFTAAQIGIQRRLVASCYNSIDHAGTSCTGILVTW